MAKNTAMALLASLTCTAHTPLIHAQPNPPFGASRLDAVQITATRFGERVQEVPLSMSVITSEELKARGANDLRTALSLLGGVNVALGGDAGPAGAVPGLLGLREVDDFLLLIDGIPAGGAFTPPFEVVSLVNVERIEVLRGAAPVYFGTTAFAGTINIIHYPAGKADPSVTLSYGSQGSVSVRGAMVVSDAQIKQSLSGEISRDRLSDPRAGFKRAQGGYRAATAVAGGQARLDVNVSLLRQKPASPSPVGETGRLSTALPPDFNQNPSDAKLDTDRYQLVFGYDKSVPYGRWGTTLSLIHSTTESVRGFLVEDFEDASGANAIGAVQSRRLNEFFIDTHLTARLAPWLDMSYGFNGLSGQVSQNSRSFSYTVPFGGGVPASSTMGSPTESTTLEDKRSFFGLYAQSRVEVSKRSTLLGGVRWNHTRETRIATEADERLTQKQRNSRWSGSLGGQVKVWKDDSGDLDDVTLHASIGNTFQPPQINFGPEAGRDPLLKPETQRSVEFGIKADGLEGRLDADLSAFFVDFANLPVTARQGGTPALANGGQQRFKGIDLETTYRPAPSLTVAGHASYSDARYRDYTTLINGTSIQLAGNRLTLAPAVLAGAGVTYAPARGWRGSLTVNHIGKRFLNKLNTVQVGGYTVADASIGFGFDRFAVLLSLSNLTNRRDPVLASELGEGQLYRMPARRAFLSLSMPLD